MFLAGVCVGAVESADRVIRLGADDTWKQWKNLLDFLDAELEKQGNNDPPVSNLIALGFAENVTSFCQATASSDGERIWDFLLQESPPALRAEIQKFP